MFKVIINLFHRIRHKEECLCMQMQRSRKTKACGIYRLKDSYYISPVSIDKETGLAFVTCPVYCVPLKTNMDVHVIHNTLYFPILDVEKMESG